MAVASTTHCGLPAALGAALAARLASGLLFACRIFAYMEPPNSSEYAPHGPRRHARISPRWAGRRGQRLRHLLCVWWQVSATSAPAALPLWQGLSRGGGVST